MFNQASLNLVDNMYDILGKSCDFEQSNKGRLGAILVNNIIDIPIVRSTTNYTNPAQLFGDIHHKLVEYISSVTKSEYNNAMIERYTSEYSKMKFHSDMALDINPDSNICIYSCYKNADTNDSSQTNLSYRRLIVKDKLTNEISEYELKNNSIIWFSADINSKYTHKIVGTGDWLGITLRLSKTYIKFINDIPYFKDTSARLTIATESEKIDLLKKRSIENKIINKSIDSIYGNINNVTLSNSDCLLPVDARIGTIITDEIIKC